ncbi:hypothetical protein D3C76_1266020 [compost metagenome]
MLSPFETGMELLLSNRKTEQVRLSHWTSMPKFSVTKRTGKSVVPLSRIGAVSSLEAVPFTVATGLLTASCSSMPSRWMVTCCFS